jgi:asparagine synthase (glutamine-hydrolysing)
MCGIAAIWGRSDVASVLKMMRRIKHRGPDGDGVHRGRSGALGHVRLAIMDPEGGRQPIRSPGGAATLVANGEIYNFPALRRRFEARGARFHTGSDSESALRLYETVAEEAAVQLDGMFALVVADGPDLYAARDPVGIKPLYIGRRLAPSNADGPVPGDAEGGEELLFASELKALAGVADEVREFPPGAWFHTRLGFCRFRELRVGEPEAWTAEESVRRIRRTLEAAVRKRLMSDVPVGAFLSGGLDSSLIAALMRREVSDLHTFSVGIEGSRDLAAARRVARHLDTKHHEYVFTQEEVLEALPEIVYHLESFDQDLVRSAIPCYFTSRLAADHVKVILTGEGADELFAGYAYCRSIARTSDLHAELHRSVCSLHNINLQRVDRLTMAHGLEGRVPFLDLDLIELAGRVPPEMKLLRRPGRPPVEKWVLRRVASDLLPKEIVWRDKEQFDEGSGTVDLLSAGLERFVSPEEAPAYRAAHADARLRSAEECAFHKLFVDAYGASEVLLANVARWAQRPDYASPQ